MSLSRLLLLLLLGEGRLGDGRLTLLRLRLVVGACIFALLDEDVQVVELALIVQLFESVEFLVVGLSIGVYLYRARRSELALRCPFTIHETHVPQIKLGLHADRTTELGQFLLQFKDTVSAVNYEELGMCLTRFILAVAKPVESIVHLAVPGRFHLPIHFLNVPEQVKPKVDAHRHL